MTTLHRLSESVRDTLDILAEGWQELWHKARNAITRFSSEDAADSPAHGNRWGFLSAEAHESGDTINTELDEAGAKATYKNGVLMISLPKTRKAQPKKIAIN